MNDKEVNQFVSRISRKLNKTCYLAIILNDEGYDIEVESNSDTIVGTFATGINSLKTARKIADAMETALKSHGIKVASTRQAWERYI